MKNQFEKICRMTQKELKKYVCTKLAKTHTEIHKGDGYVFAQGTAPILLVAHLDTVHKETPKQIIYDANKGHIYSPQGIGGDDRCGVWMILQIIKTHNCSVVFCEDEEIGGVGAEKFIRSEIAQTLKFNYAIEFDRKGSKDAVFYDCDNQDFEEFITQEFYKTNLGSFSDISVIAPYIGCAAVNLSCGYYNAHTTSEYVNINEMIASMNAACRIIERTTENDVFEYIEAIYNYSRGYGSYKQSYVYDYGYEDPYWGDEKFYMIEYQDSNGKTHWKSVTAMSKEEAVGVFCMEHINIPYENIIDIQTYR